MNKSSESDEDSQKALVEKERIEATVTERPPYLQIFKQVNVTPA